MGKKYVSIRSTNAATGFQWAATYVNVCERVGNVHATHVNACITYMLRMSKVCIIRRHTLEIFRTGSTYDKYANVYQRLVAYVTYGNVSPTYATCNNVLTEFLIRRHNNTNTD